MQIAWSLELFIIKSIRSVSYDKGGGNRITIFGWKRSKEIKVGSISNRFYSFLSFFSVAM